MTIPSIPENLFDLVGQGPLDLAGQRQREVFGSPVQILSLPNRAQRDGIPGSGRPTFQPNRADEIIAKEAVWHGPGMALTGNLFPFCERQALLWSTERRREPTLAMLEVAFVTEDREQGATMVNSMGAAGSVTRTHIHILDTQPTFLGQLAQSTLRPESVSLSDEQLHGCELLRLDPPFPVVAVGIRGEATARARAMHELLETRTSLAFNLIGVEQTSWLVPRSEHEITAPFFPQALGAAEIAGIWCCNDPVVYENLTSDDMQQAIRVGGVPWP